MSKVLCFGELLLRMSPSLNGQGVNNSRMPTYVGGAELNVATALAKWNVPVKYFTALPDNYLSEKIRTEIAEKNIDISAIKFSGNRIGIYYLPQGADLKNAGVIYDRAHSSFSELKPGMIDWEETLKDVSWFHFSAINPALNENIAAVCKEGLEVALKKGLTISIDLNYRSRLWQYGKRPVDVMPELVKYCNVIMGNLWAVENLLGISSPTKDSAGKTKEELKAAADKSFAELRQNYPVAEIFAYTFRLEKEYWAILQSGEERNLSKSFSIEKTADRVGSGDCFMAGLIYGLYKHLEPQVIIDFAAAAAVGKLQEEGDSTNQTVEKIKSLI
jgi:2-dehydro-3-deoxygluconokinase